MLSEAIKLEQKKFKKEYKNIWEKIQEYDRIAIFRHIMPDFDALGSQFGLATFIKDNFPNKEVKCFGDNHVVFTPRGLYPETAKENDEWFNQKFLGIVVDVGDKKRIADPRFEKADFLIKIDHHPSTNDELFDVKVTDINMAAAAELVVNMILSFPKELTLSKEAAAYFFSGIAGDSGRFQYGSTSAHTFDVSSILMNSGINIVKIYEQMYEKNMDDLKVTKFIYETFKISPKGVAYYVLSNQNLIDLGITCERGKENVNLFANIKGINIWCSITEDVTEPCWRISLRSRNYTINGVAAEYEGGGHAQASGAKINDLSELDGFINRLDQLIETGK
jgi:phosphoesterase RecJ-like protein